VSRLRVVAGLAIDAERRVLVGLRPETKAFPSQWEYPGGKVEPGEGDVHALTREWQEELSITPTVGHRIGRVALAFDVAVVLTLYHVRIEAQVPQVNPEAHTALQWVTPTELLLRMPATPGTTAFYALVKAYVAGLA
jgi:8-oxo-dGTP diphosphatase